MGFREAASKYQRKESESKRDIGDIPPVRDPGRRLQCSESLEAFCYEYQPNIFKLRFSPTHLEVIDILEKAITGYTIEDLVKVWQEGLFAYAMPRGTGKTSIAEAGVLFAMLTGRRKYTVLISATAQHALQSLTNIKKELSSNELILEDFPEIVYPIWALEGIALRAIGQTYCGNSTYMVWKGEQLVMPAIGGSKASSSVIEVRGITGAIRGMKANLPGGGGAIRPEFVILDDPQTDESAKSPAQCRDRERIILGTVLGLASHEKEITAVMPCTVIHRDDLAERFLDRDTRPEWQGVRKKLLVTMPTNEQLWEIYNEKKREGFKAATQFYTDNQEDLDKGAEAMWPECFSAKYVSAIHYAMDLKSKVGEAAFWSEYQNEPIDDMSDGELLLADDICGKVTSFKRWAVPPNCQHITAHIDVHRRLLFYMVCGWEENFNGYILHYGVWPDTKRKYFNLKDVDNTLQKHYPGYGEDAAIFKGLTDLTKTILAKQFKDSGLRIEKCIIDANWKTQVVKSFSRESKLGMIVIPGHGRYIGGSRKALNEYKRAAGDREGAGWRIPAALSREGVRHILYDTNFWKSIVNRGLLNPPGERGCIQLFGGKVDHKLIADHLTSQYYIQVTGRGRTVDEWDDKPGRTDTHWWDNLVGCAVGASTLGCRTIDAVRKTRGIRVSYF